LYRKKGFQDAIAAVARLVQAGFPVTLLVAGDGPYRRRLNALAAEAPAGAVRMLGNLTRRGIVELLVSSDVFALCSHVEAWGLVVNEAALAGLPLLTSDAVGASADLVVSDRNGFIYPARNRQRLFELLRVLVEREDLRRSMGRASRQILDDWRRRYPVQEGYRQALHYALG
jgi:glycosyltransferase involved in cell wall biosynthesis